MRGFKLAVVSIILLLILIINGEEGITLAAFNIKTFGKAKMSKQHVVDVLIKIIKRYDIILIQEIRDASGESIVSLLNQVNNQGESYNMTLSERLGTTSYKEQYAFMYRLSSGIDVLNTHHYEDITESFEREPYSVLFHCDKTAVSEFILMGIHVKPDNAVVELDKLVEAQSEIKSLWNNENLLLLGDLNADCSYVSKSEMSTLLIRASGFHWWINDDADTTVSDTDCAYDRFVMTGPEFIQSVTENSSSVFYFDKEYGLNETFAKDVSDHYPIELQLKGKETNTTIEESLISTAINDTMEPELSSASQVVFMPSTAINDTMEPEISSASQVVLHEMLYVHTFLFLVALNFIC